jgi:hypothetical protein
MWDAGLKTGDHQCTFTVKFSYSTNCEATIALEVRDQKNNLRRIGPGSVVKPTKKTIKVDMTAKFKVSDSKDDTFVVKFEPIIFVDKGAGNRVIVQTEITNIAFK